MLPLAVWICLAAAFMLSDRDSVVAWRSPPGPAGSRSTKAWWVIPHKTVRVC